MHSHASGRAASPGAAVAGGAVVAGGAAAAAARARTGSVTADGYGGSRRGS